jgi:hypothetical protein
MVTPTSMAATPPPVLATTPQPMTTPLPVTPPPTTPLPATPLPVQMRSSQPAHFRSGSAAPRAQFRSPPQGLAPLVTPPSYDELPLVPDIPEAGPRRAGRRFLAVFVVLLAAGGVGVRFWGKLPFPWNTRASVAAPAANVPAPPTAPTPSPEEQKAARARATTAEIERMLAAGPGFDQMTWLTEHLAALRADGAPADAAKLAQKAQAALVKAAEAELDRDEIDPGVAHYKAALALDAGEDAKGREALSESLRGHAMKALTEKKDAALAVRWAREGVTLNDSDTTHALLADMLYAAGEYESAVAEYKTALAGSPDNAAVLKRGLDRARKKMAAEKAPRSRGGKARAAKPSKAGDSDESGESGAEAEKPAAPSAPSEPAPDEQK